MDNKKVARELLMVAKELTAVNWTGSSHTDMDRVRKYFDKEDVNIGHLYMRVIEAANDLVGDFEMYGDNGSARLAKKIARDASSHGADILRGFSELRGDSYQVQHLIDRLADLIEKNEG